jgi:hypothetical protein
MAQHALVIAHVGQDRLASMLRVATGTCGCEGLITLMIKYRVTFTASVIPDRAQTLVLMGESLPSAEGFGVTSIAILVEHRVRHGNRTGLINEFRPGPSGKWKDN